MRSFLLSALLLLALSTGFSQKNGLLYSVSKKGMKTSYLFGTIHLIADSAFYFPHKLEKTFLKTDELVLEINDLDNRSGFDMKLDSGSVFDLFTPEQADSLVAWGSEALHMSPEAFRKGFSPMKPFALIQIGAQTMIKGPVRSYEMELLGKAAANGIAIGGLETMESQLALFEALADTTLRDMILGEIRHPDGGSEAMREMTAAYASQDVEALSRLIIESEEMGSNTETFIFRRNRNWIPVMVQKMTQKSCFFAVGAGHLGGEKGIIQLLKNEGYTVTPISY